MLACCSTSQPRGSILCHRHRGILLVLAAFLVLGFIYSIVTPIFEAPDELSHYSFVKYLADGWGLPVLSSGRLDPWGQEGGQPPLYYALGALLTRGINTDDMATVCRINPHADIGVITRDRNVNRIVHTPAERFPFRGTVLALHMVRWMSLLMGAVTVLAGYLLALEVFPGDKTLALGTACLTGFNAMFLFVTASVNNDALANMLAALCLWLTVKVVAMHPRNPAENPSGEKQPCDPDFFRAKLRKKANITARYLAPRRIRIARKALFGFAPRGSQWALLGVLLGLGSLTKLSLLGLIPLAGLALLFVARRHRSWKELVIGGLCLGLPIVLLGGWWYIRNWRLYGDPMGLSAFVSIIGKRHPTPTLRQLMGEWRPLVMSYWGFFGSMNVPAPGWVYWALSLFGVVGLLGIPVAVWRLVKTQRIGKTRALQLGLVALWPGVLFVSLIRWTLMTPASQGRLIFPGLTAVSLLMVVGLAGVMSKGHRALLPGMMSGLMLVIALASPFTTIRPAYMPPPLLDEEKIAPATRSAGPLHGTDVRFGEKMRLAGYEVNVDEIAPGDEVVVTLYWECLAPMQQDYSVFVHLLGGYELILGQRDMYPGQGNFATTLWQPGDRIADTYVLRVSPTAMTPDEVQIEVGLYSWETGVRLEAADSTGSSLGNSFRFGRIALPQREEEGIPNPVSVNLEERIALVGYSLERKAAAPGESFRLTLYWRALDGIDVNYSVFTQVLGERDAIWAQMDGWPQGGNSPTKTWYPGQLIEDTYELQVRADAPPGIYDLQVGMYGSGGQRLTVLGEAGYAKDTRIILGKVRILPSP